MPRCEDFPCCGHGTTESGSPDCPRIRKDGTEVWTCVECGKELPRKATSSICERCQRRLRRREWDGDF